MFGADRVNDLLTGTAYYTAIGQAPIAHILLTGQKINSCQQQLRLMRRLKVNKYIEH